MDDAVVVGVIECLGQLVHHVGDLSQRQASAPRQKLVQVRADHELHGDVGVATVALLADVVDRDDVRMVEAPGDLGFVIETLQKLLLLARAKRK